LTREAFLMIRTIFRRNLLQIIDLATTLGASIVCTWLCLHESRIRSCAPVLTNSLSVASLAVNITIQTCSQSQGVQSYSTVLAGAALGMERSSFDSHLLCMEYFPPAPGTALACVIWLDNTGIQGLVRLSYSQLSHMVVLAITKLAENIPIRTITSSKGVQYTVTVQACKTLLVIVARPGTSLLSLKHFPTTPGAAPFIMPCSNRSGVHMGLAKHLAQVVSSLADFEEAAVAVNISTWATVCSVGVKKKGALVAFEARCMIVTSG
jgi:hypothetical protein